jgi:hypothetical protein
MIAPIYPENEADRQIAVEKYKILDTLEEEPYDNITTLMSYICNAPISLITLLDKDRNYLKSHKGVPFSESPRNISFCGHAINSKAAITVIEDVYNFNRYKPKSSNFLKGYAIFQLLANTSFLLFMLYNYSENSFNDLLLYSGFVFVGIFGYTSLMDRKLYAVWVEIVRGIGGFTVLFLTRDWFGINSYFALGRYAVALYFLTTILLSMYFIFLEKENS